MISSTLRNVKTNNYCGRMFFDIHNRYYGKIIRLHSVDGEAEMNEEKRWKTAGNEMKNSAQMLENSFFINIIKLKNYNSRKNTRV